MGGPTALVWFRHDLRLTDQPALHAAVASGGAVVPVFVWSPEEEGDWVPGGASRWWLHHCLAALGQALGQAGSRLVLRRGPAAAALAEVARKAGASSLHFGPRWEPAAQAQEERVRAELAGAGVAVHPHPTGLVFPPGAVQRAGGGAYQVFTPYWRACQAAGGPQAPLPAPGSLKAPRRWPPSLPLAGLGLLPRLDWAAGLRAAWQPGEAGAQRALAAFLSGGLPDYETGRDLLGEAGVSQLSPHLHFGGLSPAQVWRAVAGQPGSGPYQRQLGWREFAHHLLHHFPHTPTQALRPEFSVFPWLEDAPALRAWQQGRTGYPLVDAGMRQLWQTGWMHNRARMVAASFLVKHLLIRWQEGARWFWHTLVDADLANNTLGWQWAAGCGADAAPYFRIFNPALQGQRFDPQGQYVRRWVPELAGLPDAWVHQPCAAPAAVLAGAGVVLGRSYPFPLVDHTMARQRALAALAEMKRRLSGGR